MHRNKQTVFSHEPYCFMEHLKDNRNTLKSNPGAMVVCIEVQRVSTGQPLT